MGTEVEPQILSYHIICISFYSGPYTDKYTYIMHIYICIRYTIACNIHIRYMIYYQLTRRIWGTGKTGSSLLNVCAGTGVTILIAVGRDV